MIEIGSKVSIRQNSRLVGAFYANGTVIALDSQRRTATVLVDKVRRQESFEHPNTWDSVEPFEHPVSVTDLALRCS